MLLRACIIARLMLDVRSSSCAVSGVTVGLLSLALRSSRLRVITMSLYLSMSDVAEASDRPTFDGKVWYLFDGSFIYSEMLFSNAICVLASANFWL